VAITCIFFDLSQHEDKLGFPIQEERHSTSGVIRVPVARWIPGLGKTTGVLSCFCQEFFPGIGSRRPAKLERLLVNRGRSSW